MSDSLFQNLSTVQSNKQPSPKTIASATSIGTAVETFISIITGTTAIATITPPVTGQHMLVLIFTNGNPGGVTTGGATTGRANIEYLLKPAIGTEIVWAAVSTTQPLSSTHLLAASSYL